MSQNGPERQSSIGRADSSQAMSQHVFVSQGPTGFAPGQAPQAKVRLSFAPSLRVAESGLPTSRLVRWPCTARPSAALVTPSTTPPATRRATLPEHCLHVKGSEESTPSTMTPSSAAEPTPMKGPAAVERQEGIRTAEALTFCLHASPSAEAVGSPESKPCFFPEGVRYDERKILRLALRRYREDLQAQINSAEEVIQDLSPQRPQLRQAALRSTSLRSRSASPEALPFSQWPSTAQQPARRGAPSATTQHQMQARQALELALQEAMAPAVAAASVPLDPRSPSRPSSPVNLEAARSRRGSQLLRPRPGGQSSPGPSRATSRATSRQASRAASRAPSCGPSGAATPEVPPAPESPLDRLQLALAFARRCGVEDFALIDKAESFIKLQESRKQAIQLTVSKISGAFERARINQDLAAMKQLKEQLAQLKSYSEVDRLRRRVHNAIEDAKGNLRVYCRVRPLSLKEQEMGEEVVVRMVDDMRLELPRNGVFNFDGVFAAGRQDEIFQECKDLVQSAVDGHNVTIFAYGQTGAGKTHTLYGTLEQEGIAGRAISELFQILARGERRYVVSASMFELYRNRLVDLLCRRQKGAAAPRLRAGECGMQVENLCSEEVKEAMQLKRLLYRGLEGRSTAANALNAQSSRSHLIFTIKVTTFDEGEQLSGKIVLCDLGGSERLKKSEATGERLKEAIEINRSLTCLGDVIEAVAERKRQVPYRNHKLTQLLQDSLGGSAKTLMFVNCSPARCNLHETAMSLNYALRAKRVVNQVPRKVWASR